MSDFEWITKDLFMEKCIKYLYNFLGISKYLGSIQIIIVEVYEAELLKNIRKISEWDHKI